MKRLLKIEPILGILLILTGPFAVAIRFSSSPAPALTESRGIEAVALILLTAALGFIGGAMFVRSLDPQRHPKQPENKEAGRAYR
jgi:hypothetical protein